MPASPRVRPLVVALTFLSVCLGAALYAPGSSAEGPLVVWPVGDSITYGASRHHHTVPGGYRLPLARDLAERGVRVRYVGTLTANGARGLAAAGWAHDGHSGWRADQVLAALPTWRVPTPDVVVVHLGTNDLRQGATPVVAAIRLDAVVTSLTMRFPRAAVVVASVVPSGAAGTCDERTAEYAELVRGLVATHREAGERVVAADPWEAFVAEGCRLRPGLLSRDALHPSAAGYGVLAHALAEVLAPLARGRRTLDG